MQESNIPNNFKPFFPSSFDEAVESDNIEVLGLKNQFQNSFQQENSPENEVLNKEPSIEEIVETAYKRGFEEGFDKALKQAEQNSESLVLDLQKENAKKIDELETIFNEQTKMLLINLESSLQSIIDEAELKAKQERGQLEQLCFLIASKIADEALKASGFKNIENLIATSFDKVLKNQTKILIKLNPLQQNLWNKELKELFAKYQKYNFELVLDESIAVNNCEIHYENGKIVYDSLAVKNQIEQIIKL